MTVAELIEELKKFSPDMPICIGDNMSFINMFQPTIEVKEDTYITFPFTDMDKFNYISLKSINELEEW